jgi:hypothetical protein
VTKHNYIQWLLLIEELLTALDEADEEGGEAAKVYDQALLPLHLEIVLLGQRALPQEEWVGRVCQLQLQCLNECSVSTSPKQGRVLA